MHLPLSLTTTTARTLRPFLKTLIKSVLSCLTTVVFACSAWGSVTADVIVSTDRSSAATSISTPTFSTHSANELLLAFISTDAKSAGITITGVTSTGLTWVLVQRANAQMGTVEIWRAFASGALSNVAAKANISQSVAASITVMTFTGVDTSGVNGSGAIGNANAASASSGTPSVSLTTSHNGSWIVGVGNDWDRAVVRTPGTNQSLVHQFLSSNGDTYWVQQQNNPIPLSGTQVSINDTAPISDRYNVSMVEIVAASGGASVSSISGTLSPAFLVTGTTITLTFPSGGTATAVPDNSGNYIFSNLSDSTYKITRRSLGRRLHRQIRPLRLPARMC